MVDGMKDYNAYNDYILSAKVTALETQMKDLQDTLGSKVQRLEALYIKHHGVLEQLAPFCKGMGAKVKKLEEDLANIRMVVPDLPPLDDEKMPPWEDYVKVKEEKVEPMR